MKLYRHLNAKELKRDQLGFYVDPKPFVENKDSSIPTGVWSFWFDKPIKMDCDFGVIVEADFTPEMESIMKWTTSFEWSDDYGDIEYTDHEIEEYVTSKRVYVSKIWVGELSTMAWTIKTHKKESWELLPEFPYLVEGYFHYRSFYGQQFQISSFVEVCTGLYFDFPYNKGLEIKPVSECNHVWYDTSYLVATELLGELYAGNFKWIKHLDEF